MGDKDARAGSQLLQQPLQAVELGRADPAGGVPGPEITDAGIDADEPDIANPLSKGISGFVQAFALLPGIEACSNSPLAATPAV